jgi:hypothetical protein
MRHLLGMTALLTAACVELPIDNNEEWALQEHVDAGEVCLGVDDAGDLTAMVRVQECMSSSCSRDYVSSCALSFDGTSLTLQSDISWEDNISPDAMCTDDCGIPLAECTLADLPDGTYEVAFGAETLTLVWPLTEPCSVF